MIRVIRLCDDILLGGELRNALLGQLVAIG